MSISVNQLYKVAAKATVRGFMANDMEETPAHVLMDIDIAEYDEDPLLIKPEAFIVYDAEADRSDIAVGNTNYLQHFAIWTDPSGNEYYVNVNKLEVYAS